MSSFIIGDVHGQAQALEQLLEVLKVEKGFDQKTDKLIFVGDLVNRGPDSLKVLRMLTKISDTMGSRLVSVLGNHDIYLLQRAASIKGVKEGDTLKQLLQAPDCQELLDWLRSRPFIYHTKKYIVVHAGVHPNWDLKEALHQGEKLSTLLGADNWKEELKNINSKLKNSLDIFCKMRMLENNGDLSKYKGAPEDAPKSLQPWYFNQSKAIRKMEIYFGHWSTLGLRKMENVYCLDSGASWGKSLSALCIEDRQVLDVSV